MTTDRDNQTVGTSGRVAERELELEHGRAAWMLATAIEEIMTAKYTLAHSKRLRVATLMYCLLRRGITPLWARGRCEVGPEQFLVTIAGAQRALGTKGDIVGGLLWALRRMGVAANVGEVRFNSTTSVPLREFAWSMNDATLDR